MTADQLPDDPDVLKAMVLARDVENARLTQIIKELQRHRFGRRAESLPEDQLLLGLEEAEQIEAAGAEETERADPTMRKERPAKRRTNRGSLPPHLPRAEMVVDIEDHSCPCCGNGLHRIGEDVSERLDIVPAQLRVIVVRRPKYACRACEDVVVQAPAPARLIEGGLPTEADGRPGAGLQICRSSAALSPGADLCPAGHRPRPLHARRLGRACRLASAPRS